MMQLKILDDGNVVVRFFGDLHALLPKEELEGERTPKIGSVLRVRVSNIFQSR